MAWFHEGAGADKLFYKWSVRYQTAAAVNWYVTKYAGAPSPGDYATTTLHKRRFKRRTQSWSKRQVAWHPDQGGKESITYLLDAAANNGMKVWLGLYLGSRIFAVVESMTKTTIIERQLTVLRLNKCFALHQLLKI